MNTDSIMIDIINLLVAPYGISMSHMVADIMNRISTQRTIN